MSHIVLNKVIFSEREGEKLLDTKVQEVIALLYFSWFPGEVIWQLVNIHGFCFVLCCLLQL